MGDARPWYLKPSSEDRSIPLAERLDGVQLDWIHDHGLFSALLQIKPKPGERIYRGPCASGDGGECD